MLVKLRGNIGDTVIYYTGDGGTDESKIMYVDITVFKDRYDAQYVLENGAKVSPKHVISVQHRHIEDIQVLDTIDR